jgi:HJR/Mrr/RecB family endonuclease
MSSQGESRRFISAYMDELDGDDFTDHMVRVFDKVGYDVKRTKKRKGGGKDIIMYGGKDLYCVERKH